MLVNVERFLRGGLVLFVVGCGHWRPLVSSSCETNPAHRHLTPTKCNRTGELISWSGLLRGRAGKDLGIRGLPGIDRKTPRNDELTYFVRGLIFMRAFSSLSSFFPGPPCFLLQLQPLQRFRLCNRVPQSSPTL